MIVISIRLATYLNSIICAMTVGKIKDSRGGFLWGGFVCSTNGPWLASCCMNFINTFFRQDCCSVFFLKQTTDHVSRCSAFSHLRWYSLTGGNELEGSAVGSMRVSCLARTCFFFTRFTFQAYDLIYAWKQVRLKVNGAVFDWTYLMNISLQFS